MYPINYETTPHTFSHTAFSAPAGLKTPHLLQHHAARSRAEGQVHQVRLGTGRPERDAGGTEESMEYSPLYCLPKVR